MPHIARCLLRERSIPARGCNTPIWHCFSHRHVYAVPHVAAYHAMIVLDPTRTCTKDLYDTIVMIIAQCEGITGGPPRADCQCVNQRFRQTIENIVDLKFKDVYYGYGAEYSFWNRTHSSRIIYSSRITTFHRNHSWGSVPVPTESCTLGLVGGGSSRELCPLWKIAQCLIFVGEQEVRYSNQTWPDGSKLKNQSEPHMYCKGLAVGCWMLIAQKTLASLPSMFDECSCNLLRLLRSH